LNVAKYYDYKPYDATGERAAQKDRYDATMQLQKELESASERGDKNELDAYRTLAEYRSKMSNDELGRILEIMQLTKQATQIGFDTQTNSIFEPKQIMELMKMDREDRNKYLEMSVDILTKMIGANAAGNAARQGGERQAYTEVEPPDQRRLDQMLGMVDSVAAASFTGTNQTPKQMVAEIDNQLRGKAEKNYMTGNVTIDSMSVRLLNEIKNHLASLPPDTVIANPAAYLRSWVKDPEVLMRLGVVTGQQTEYQGGKPVSKKPITSLPPGTRVPVQGSDKAGPVPQRGAAPAPAEKGRATLVRRNGQLVNRNTGAPISSRQELDQIVAEDAKRGFKYPPEILNSVK
jgi:hypothetical protein